MLPVFTEQPITADELIQAAVVAAEREAETIRAQMDAVRES